MANEYAVNQADLKAIADAIREKGGTSDALEFPGGFVDAVGAIQAGSGGEGEVVTVTGWVRPSEWPAQPKDWKNEACMYMLIDCTGELAYLHLNGFSGNAYMGTTAADGTFVADSDDPIALVNGRVYLKDEDFGNRDYCWVKVVPSDSKNFSFGFYYTTDANGMNGGYSTVVEHLMANVSTSMSRWYMDSRSTIAHVHAFNCTFATMENVAYCAVSLKRFNLENCTVSGSAYRAFVNCTLLEDLLFDGTTVTVSDITNLFNGCNMLREVDLSGWTFTGKDARIFQSNMYALKKMNLIGFKTTGTLTTNQIGASYARSLESIDLSLYASAPITKLNLDRLTSIRELSFPPNNWALTSFSIREAVNLERLDVSNLDFTGVTNLAGSGALWTLSKLQHCSAINAKVSIQFNGSPLLTHESLMNIINGLPTVETTQTLTVGSVNTAKLTEDEIAIATEKGWTVA